MVGSSASPPFSLVVSRRMASVAMAGSFGDVVERPQNRNPQLGILR